MSYIYVRAVISQCHNRGEQKIVNNICHIDAVPLSWFCSLSFRYMSAVTVAHQMVVGNTKSPKTTEWGDQRIRLTCIQKIGFCLD